MPQILFWEMKGSSEQKRKGWAKMTFPVESSFRCRQGQTVNPGGDRCCEGFQRRDMGQSGWG